MFLGISRSLGGLITGALVSIAAVGCSGGQAKGTLVKGVVTVKGQPAAGVIVNFHSGSNQVASTTTLANGQYTLEGVPSGAVTVSLMSVSGLPGGRRDNARRWSRSRYWAGNSRWPRCPSRDAGNARGPRWKETGHRCSERNPDGHRGEKPGNSGQIFQSRNLDFEVHRRWERANHRHRGALIARLLFQSKQLRRRPGTFRGGVVLLTRPLRVISPTPRCLPVQSCRRYWCGRRRYRAVTAA